MQRCLIEEMDEFPEQLLCWVTSNYRPSVFYPAEVRVIALVSQVELNDSGVLCDTMWKRIASRVLLMLRSIFAHSQSVFDQIWANAKMSEMREVRQAIAKL